MKRIITVIAAVIITTGLFAQAPQKMTYQSVVRDGSGSLIRNTAIGVRITIVKDSATGSPVYREAFTPNPQTNANGLVTVEVGGGTPSLGTFAGIDWSTGPYFIKTEADPTGGTTYTISGTSQLLSVPYALYAGSASSGTQRIVAGSTNGGNSPTITSGSGFTISAIGVNTGQYQITFNVPFTTIPTITTTLYGTASGLNAPFSMVTSVSTTGFQVKNYVYDAQGGVFGSSNRAFSFIAVGN